MKPNRKPKAATVIDSLSLTPNMLRIVLQGDDFKQLQPSDLGGYIKLMFHPEGHTDIRQVPEGQRPIMRTYTISELNLDRGEISVDFVKHEIVSTEDHSVNTERGGYAIAWAMHASVGDNIFIGGPGSSQDIDFSADQCILIADMTAIPAVSAKITTLSEDAIGDVFVQLTSPQDMPNWTLPKGVKLHTVIGDDPEQLADAVTQVEIQNQDIALWCACEFTAMKTIRAHFTEKDLIQRDKSYFSSYWKQGVTEDGHKMIKREDAERGEG
ncbi:siderophore-interacting protein [Vibrio rumoiensis]|uniref:FAD-binding FR-type domain-containing protein n=1 Tax=Vibrio rumoiensis 1S-45 TaxID=1188252 RepID=A0A1E5E446_9VIBR|nr:siderophore-interacting protein [Vibrio rumoiensis]OEF27454.1 hypothetical protein A1QC_15025 [Vibrio rumoiensis 1S-45]